MNAPQAVDTGAALAWTFGIIAVLLVLGLAIASVRIVPQATIAVVTRFGKYNRVLRTGLRFVIPIIESSRVRIRIQNQAAQYKFMVITADQAVVQIAATLVFTPSDDNEETIKKVAYRFVSGEDFIQALNASVEATVREFVSQKMQAEILGARSEIVAHAKRALDAQVADWGYTIADLQVNDIQFDKAVTDSMSRVVAAKNQKTAAEFEGDALLITRTKAAEAEGAFIRIAAENEKIAAQLRGEGLAQFRKAITSGLKVSAQELAESGLDASILALSMWTETLSKIGVDGRGNTILIDGNVSGLEQTLRRFEALGLGKVELPPYDDPLESRLSEVAAEPKQ